MESKELKRAQTALAMLLKELFLLPYRLENWDTVCMFSDIIIEQAEKGFDELFLLLEMEDEA